MIYDVSKATGIQCAQTFLLLPVQGLPQWYSAGEMSYCVLFAAALTTTLFCTQASCGCRERSALPTSIRDKSPERPGPGGGRHERLQGEETESAAASSASQRSLDGDKIAKSNKMDDQEWRNCLIEMASNSSGAAKKRSTQRELVV